ncbi:ArsR/SmtB family transcription factor [Singulisphaera rosea]
MILTTETKPLIKRNELALEARMIRRAASQLKQISETSRFQIILMLASAEKNVGTMCHELGHTQPAVSHHLALLRHGGIISVRRQGRSNYYGLTETGRHLAIVLQRMIEHP